MARGERLGRFFGLISLVVVVGSATPARGDYIAIKCGGITLNNTAVPPVYGNVSYGAGPDYMSNVSVIVTGPGNSTVFFRQDSFFSGHNTSVVNYGFVTVNNTNNSALYQSERVGRSIVYDLNLPAGLYTVQLFFAELDLRYFTNGSRQFDISIQNSKVAPKFDIIAAAGSPYTAVAPSFNTQVGSSNVLHIQLDSQTYNALAKVNALYVRPQDQLQPLPTNTTAANATVFINVGSSLPIVTPDRGVFQVDEYFVSGDVRTYNTPLKNVGPEYAPLFTSARAGNYIGYVVNVKAAGDYKVDFFFAEPELGIQAGQRLMNLYINGVQVEAALDLYRAAVTPGRAVVVSKAGHAANRQLRIDMFAANGEALLFGLGISPLNTTNQTVFALDCGSPADTLGPDGLIYTKDDNSTAVVVPTGFNTTSTTSPPAVDPSAAIYKQPVNLPRYVNEFLYLSIRLGSFDYRISVPNGDYVVDLFFAELGPAVKGTRLFNVDVQGLRELSNLDVVDAAFGNATAISYQYPVTVKNGTLTVSFRNGPQGQPFISALFVHPDIPGHHYTSFGLGTVNSTDTQPKVYPMLPPNVTAASLPCPAVAGPPRAVNCTGPCATYAPPGSIAINAGSPTGYNSSCGVIFLPDDTQCDPNDQVPVGSPYCRTNIKGPSGGYAYQDQLNTVNGTTDPTIYLSERIGYNTYKFRCTPGQNYVWSGYFAEISGDDPNIDVQAPGLREFTVFFNGANYGDPGLGPVDPFAAAGNRKFVADRPFAQVVPCPQSGTLSSQLAPGGLRDAPAIKGVWIYQGNSLPSLSPQITV